MIKPEIIKILKVLTDKKAKRKAKLRPKETINHFHTKTTQETIRISDDAVAELKKIAKRIESDIQNGVSYKKIKETYKDEIGTIVASAIREIYLLGLKYVEGYYEKSIELTPEVIKKMNEYIQKTIDNIWSSIEIFYYRANEEKNGIEIKILSKNAYDEFNFLLTLTNFFQILISVSTQESLNNATAEITISISVKTPFLPPPDLLFVSERDSKVCPICLNYDGRQYNIEDYDRPRIPRDTHPNCRCRYMLMSGGQAYNA